AVADGVGGEGDGDPRLILEAMPADREGDELLQVERRLVGDVFRRDGRRLLLRAEHRGHDARLRGRLPLVVEALGGVAIGAEECQRRGRAIRRKERRQFPILVALAERVAHHHGRARFRLLLEAQCSDLGHTLERRGGAPRAPVAARLRRARDLNGRVRRGGERLPAEVQVVRTVPAHLANHAFR
ncbi:MAG: hypothetical protein ACK5QX_10875, partial [bacterium]